jgi:hypothetical protein
MTSKGGEGQPEIEFSGIYAYQKNAIYQKLKQNREFQLFLQWTSGIHVRTKDEGFVKFTPDRWLYSQWLAVEALFSGKKQIVILKARQLGITTICVIFDLFNAFLRPNLKGAILSGDYKLIREIRSIIRDATKMIPPQYRIPVVTDNNFQVAFKNGNTFSFYYPTLKKKSEGTMGRGGATNYGHFTEVAFFANVQDLDAFVSSLSEKYPHRKYIFESTANGVNHFYEMWKLNQKAPDVASLFIGWWANDSYVIDDKENMEYYKDPVFDWEPEKIEEVKQRYGVEITQEQIVWFRKRAKEKHSLNEEMVLQEFPFTEDDAFRTTGKRAFRRDIIDNIIQNVTPPKKRYTYFISDNLKEAQIAPSAFGKLCLWEDFEDIDRKITYIIGVDPSLSLNPDSDNTCVQVIKCWADRIEQVAELAGNDIDEYHLAFIVAYLAAKYKGMVNIELQGGGHGSFIIFDNLLKYIRSSHFPPDSPLEEIKSTMFKEYLYYRRDSLTPSFAKHTYMTHQLKLRAFKGMEAELRSGRMILRSRALAEELNKIVRDGDNYSAHEGNDDRVMALAIALLAYQDINPAILPKYSDYQAEKESYKGEEKPIERFKKYLINAR